MHTSKTHMTQVTCIHCKYIHTYIHTYMRGYIHAYIHTYIHTYMRGYIQVYIHAYTDMRAAQFDSGEYFIKMRGIPFTARERDVYDFFAKAK